MYFSSEKVKKCFKAWTAEDDARLVSMPFDEILDEIKAEILDAAEDSIQFDTFGLQAPFVNALRRILLSQVCLVKNFEM